MGPGPCRLAALQGGPRPRLSASDLLLLGALVCDMDASSIAAADPQVLRNLRRCSRLTAAQQAALNRLLASGRSVLGWVGPSPLPRPLPHHRTSNLWPSSHPTGAPQPVGCGLGGCHPCWALQSPLPEAWHQSLCRAAWVGGRASRPATSLSGPEG